MPQNDKPKLTPQQVISMANSALKDKSLPMDVAEKYRTAKEHAEAEMLMREVVAKIEEKEKQKPAAEALR
tara:strand:+ start:231 stop:440 length:210 start_codon:yes stop_codon:yes gene_type:complete